MIVRHYRTIQILFITWSILTCFSAVSQSDSLTIKEEIQLYKSEINLIEDGRNLLWDYFVKRDQKKVSNILFYMLGTPNTNYHAFYPMEKLLLLYYTENYHLIMEEKGYIYPQPYRSFEVKTLYPRADPMRLNLKGDVANMEDTILLKIDQSFETQEDKDFLTLYFKFLTYPNRNRSNHDELNTLADEFIRKYPESNFNNYIAGNIRVKTFPSKWAYAWSFSAGVGLLNHGLDEYFLNPMGNASLDYDVNYEKLSILMKLKIGGITVQDSIDIHGAMWYHETELTAFSPELDLGYILLNTKLVKFTPHIGIGITSISPSSTEIDERPELEKSKIRPVWTYSLGATIDFSLYNKTGGYGESENLHDFLRLRYSYAMPQFDKKIPLLDGDIQYISLGYGIYFRNTLRNDKHYIPF